MNFNKKKKSCRELTHCKIYADILKIEIDLDMKLLIHIWLSYIVR